MLLFSVLNNSTEKRMKRCRQRKKKRRNDKDLTEIQAILVAGNVKFTAYSLFSARNSEISKLKNQPA